MIIKEERQQQILRKLHIEGKVLVNDLAELFQTSKDTIRRDLYELESNAQLKRVFGGALPFHLPVANYSEREKVHRDSKYAIAKKALMYLKENQLLAIDGSSTNHVLAYVLPTTIKLTVITNSFPIANELRNHHNIKVLILGGEYLSKSMTNVGDIACKQLALYHPDICFIGAYAIDPAFGLSSPFEEEVAIKRDLVACSKKTIALVTTDKLYKKSKYKVCDMREIDILLCDDQQVDVVENSYPQNIIK